MNRRWGGGNNSLPDVRVLLHVGQQALDGFDALRVGAAGGLADQSLLVVGLEPGGGVGEALLADRGGYAGFGCAGAVGVEVLVLGEGG